MKSLEEIELIRKEQKEKLKMRLSGKKNNKKQILVCGGTGCTSSKSEKLIEKLNEEIYKQNLNNVEVILTGCFGLCAKGPIMIVKPENVFYSLVNIEDVNEIVEMHIKRNIIVKRLLCEDIDNKKIKKLKDLTFYKKQKRNILKYCGEINPENIDEFIGVDGYKALEKSLKRYSREEIINIIKESGLRGRRRSWLFDWKKVGTGIFSRKR